MAAAELLRSETAAEAASVQASTAVAQAGQTVAHRAAAPTLSDPRAYDIARAMLDGFDRHYTLFRQVSAAAKKRFEGADWAGQQRAQRERIEFYDKRVGEGVERLEREFLASSLSQDTWQLV